MGNLHRIQWIDQRIRAGQYPNCTAIAAQFEISGRQAARDIEYLRDSLGAPIAYSAKHNGYVYKGSEFRLPQLALSVEDKDTLRTLSVQYARAENQNARRLAELFSRLSCDGNHQPGHDTRMQHARKSAMQADMPADMPLPDGDDPVLLMYHQLDLAYQLRRKVNLTYVDARHRATTRVVHPYLLFTRAGTPYLVAHCELRRQVRVFSLKRVTQVDTLRTGYTIAETFRPAEYRTMPSAPPRKCHTAAVLFPATMKVRPYFPPPNAPPPVSQVNGVWEFPFESSMDFLSWLLGHPPGFRLLKPAWLLQRLTERLSSLMENHPSP